LRALSLPVLYLLIFRYKLLFEKCKTCKKRFTKEDSDAMRNDAAVRVRGEIPRTGIQGFL